MSAGELRRRLTFYSQPFVSGSGGKKRGAPVEEFTISGGLKPRFGGEEVMAARLQSRQPYTLRIRQNARTRRIGTDWQIKDSAGTAYNIRTIVDLDEKRAYFEMLIESGVAA